MPTCPPPKRPVVGSETPPVAAFIRSPLPAPRGGTDCVQPQSIPASSPAILCQSLWRRGEPSPHFHWSPPCPGLPIYFPAVSLLSLR